jgi:hypothetical protein
MRAPRRPAFCFPPATGVQQLSSVQQSSNSSGRGSVLRPTHSASVQRAFTLANKHTKQTRAMLIWFRDSRPPSVMLQGSLSHNKNSTYARHRRTHTRVTGAHIRTTALCPLLSLPCLTSEASPLVCGPLMRTSKTHLIPFIHAGALFHPLHLPRPALALLALAVVQHQLRVGFETTQDGEKASTCSGANSFFVMFDAAVRCFRWMDGQ